MTKQTMTKKLSGEDYGIKVEALLDFLKGVPLDGIVEFDDYSMEGPDDWTVEVTWGVTK